ncbi:MAG: class I SAM-dependent methyltransferase, partial [Candidatus Acidiferrales bacterium]
VTGLYLTPELLERARENGRVAGVEVDWHEGDVEHLPFADESFDAVLSQFGHIFAPRPEVAVSEMLRVLKPGGTIAFSTWPPELFVGRMFSLTASYMPPPPPGVPPPPLWGDPSVVRQRLGDSVRDIIFDRATMTVFALSPAHHRAVSERAAGPMVRLVAELSAHDPAKLAEFRARYEALASEYFEDNILRQDYLITRATKKQ